MAGRRGGWEKSARRLETSRGAFSAGVVEEGDEDGDEEEGIGGGIVRCVDWSSIGACGSGERCALATCSTAGACEAFAPPRGTTSAWTRKTDVSEAWRRACYGGGGRVEALVVEAPVDVDEAASVRPTRARELASPSAAARAREDAATKTELDDAETVKPAMETMNPSNLPRSSVDDGEFGDDVYVYGAPRSGARGRRTAGDAATWRAGTVVSASFNAATRARIEYDARDVRGEFLVWSLLERRPPNVDGVEMFPPESTYPRLAPPAATRTRASDAATTRRGRVARFARGNL